MAFQTLCLVAFRSSTHYKALSVIRFSSELPQPLTGEVMKFILQSSDLSNKEHIMLWAPCRPIVLSFLRVRELIVNSPFDPGIHLTSEDCQVDSRFDSSCLQVQIKCSKADPCCCLIYLGRGSLIVCPISAIPVFLALQGSSSGSSFQQGCFIYLGPGSSSMCLISANLAFLTLQGSLSGPFFQHKKALH